MILTVQLTQAGGTVTAIATPGGARGEASTVPGALAVLGLELEIRYLQLRATARWPHEQRTLEQLARFYEEAP